MGGASAPHGQDRVDGSVHLDPASDERSAVMRYRISLSLLLVVGCTVSQNDDTGADTSASEGTQPGTSQGSGDSGTAQVTDAVPTGSSGDNETEGGQSASGTGTSTGVEETGSTSSSGTSGELSSTGEPVECMGKGLKAVDLGSSNDLAAAGNYVLLAKTAITNVTGSAISDGDVGLSPAAATFITGFSMIADPSGEFSTSASVVAPGKIYAANYAVPTPTNLTTAIGSMQTAYTDAAGRENPDFLDLKSGDLGGLTLEPGLYKFGSTVLIPTDVTLEGCPDDVWIFQIDNDLDLSAAKHMILAGGAQASNIFWQVAGQATIHANAHFEGIILAKTGITLQTEASLHGRALAQSMIALDDNAVTAP